MTKQSNLKDTAHISWRAVFGAILVFAGQSALAAGFYIDEIGTPASIGTAGAANVTNNWGADSAWSNPAGLTGVHGTTSLIGTTALIPNMEFDPDVAGKGGNDGDNAGDMAVIPSFFFKQDLTDDWKFGFALTVLQGGGVDYGDQFVGRYAATKVNLTGLATTYSVGYRVNDRFSIGFGGSVAFTNFEQDIAIDQGALPDGKVKFTDLDDVGVQPIVGLMYKATDRTTLGLTYRGEFDAKLKGNIQFKNLAAPLPPQANLDLDWTNPQWIEAGIHQRFGENRHFFARANWQEWSKFSDNQLGVETTMGTAGATLDRQWDDTWSVAVAFATADSGASGWSVGAAYESSPVSDGNRTIDLPMDESWSISTSYARARPQKSWDWSVGATFQKFGDAEVDQSAQGVRFAGEFDNMYVIYVGGTIRFGGGNP